MRPLPSTVPAAVLVALLATSLVPWPAGAGHVPASRIVYACGPGSGPDDCGIDPVGGGGAVQSAGAPEHGDAWIEDGEEVLGVVVNGTARAYPLKMLSRHEIVNDEFDGRPITVTYCPLCGSGVVFDPETEVDGTVHTLTFAASGYLYKQDLVMWDPQTGTLWNQLLGAAIGRLDDGRVRTDHPDAELTILTSTIATWEAWRTEHPDSTMIQPVHSGYSDPYTRYYENCQIGVGGGSDCKIRDIHPKARIVGTTVGNASAAYVVEAVQQAGGVVVDAVDGRTLVVTTAGGGPRIFDAGNRTFERQDGAWVDDEGRTWDLERGVRADGQARLEEMTSLVSFWFAWQDLHPETSVFTGGDPSVGTPPRSTPGPGAVGVLAALGAGLAWGLVRRRR